MRQLVPDQLPLGGKRELVREVAQLPHAGFRTGRQLAAKERIRGSTWFSRCRSFFNCTRRYFAASTASCGR
jgi:hypothetical protein